jgi:hypothetical protein
MVPDATMHLLNTLILENAKGWHHKVVAISAFRLGCVLSVLFPIPDLRMLPPMTFVQDVEARYMLHSSPGFL